MDELYSVRMRAAQGGPHENGGHHISGAERIVTLNQVGSNERCIIVRGQLILLILQWT